MVSFTAIDFETANSDRASVCAVGGVKVKNGQIADKFYTLILPPEHCRQFSEKNIKIHKITPEMVRMAPEFDAVFPDLEKFIDGDLVVGHNIKFDISVLLNACSSYEIDWPLYKTLCTLELARKSYQIASYSLPWVVDYLKLPIFDHHNPVQDAESSARVLLQIIQAYGGSLESVLQSLNQKIGYSYRDDSSAALNALESEMDSLYGTGFEAEVVCFTGSLRSMVRREAESLVRDHGGETQSGVTKRTTIVVTGDFDSRTFRPGAEFSSKLQKALDLVEKEQKIEIITEDEFVSRLALSNEELSERLSLADAKKVRLPGYVLEQSRVEIRDDYWRWFQNSLKHPAGRASGGERCIWCDSAVPSNAYWIHRDRHVCGIYCNERLKRSAKRAWKNANLL